MTFDYPSAPLFLPVLVATAQFGGLICVRRIASQEGVDPVAVLDAVRDLDRMGVLTARLAEIDGMVLCRFTALAVRAIWFFALNLPGDASPAPLPVSPAGESAVVS